MKKILYIIDDINYNSGAKQVTLFQMNKMQEVAEIFLLSLVPPLEKIAFLDEKHILMPELWETSEIYAISFKEALTSLKYTISKKISRILYAICLRLGLGEFYFENVVCSMLLSMLEQFDDIIVVSEASKLRRLVSRLKKPKKIQWIHTDYGRWCEFSEWSRAITKHDKAIYPKFDHVIVLSEYCKKGLIEKLPEIADKVVVIPNMIDGDKILTLAKEQCPIEIISDYTNLVTVARVDREKQIDKIIQLASEMNQRQMKFRWYIMGDGPLRAELELKNQRLGLEENVVFLGYQKNPYSIMSKCDTMVLLSKYEGTPVTIDEAMILGLRILAPRIGGIPEQVRTYSLCKLYTVISVDDIILNSKKAAGVDYNVRNRKIKKIISEIL